MKVIVVGAGILGSWHAREALARGHEVIHLDREGQARGASVRNFGLVWVGGRAAGPELDLALRARERWEKLAREIPGAGFRPHGSLTLAQNDAELAVLQAAADLPDAAAREFSVLDPDGVRTANPALRGSYLGGLWCRRDAIVEPRLASRAIREHLLSQPGYAWLPNREVVDIAAHQVRDQLGHQHRGDLVVLCTGAAHGGPLGEALATAPIRRVRLQMLQTAPYDEQLSTSVADGDSLRYYPAYDVPARAGLAPQDPLAARWHAQLLLVQRLDGSLTIGDTHAYDEPFDFDVQEAPYDQLRARAEALLGRRLPPTVRRWAGVYSQSTGDLYHRSEIAPGVVLVTGAGGRGMTCAPAIAEDTFA